MPYHALTIRATNPTGAKLPATLQALGPRSNRAGRSLVAEIDGTTVAAISLTTGAVAADLDRVDPRTVRRLKYRRYQILRQGGNVTAAQTLPQRLELSRIS